MKTIKRIVKDKGPIIETEKSTPDIIMPHGPTYSPKEVTISRGVGGLGDVVMCLGAVEGWKKVHPNCSITFAAPAPLLEVAKEHPSIDHVEEFSYENHKTSISLGCEGDIAMRCPAAFHESRMEDQVYLDRISLFCQSIGVPKTIPRIHLTEDEIKSAPFCKDYACLVLRTSTISRDYYDMEGLFKLLDIPIVVVDHEKTILNSRSTAGMSIRQTCAVIKNSRMVITPDTGWLHVAGALKKPIFGLFGNMPAEFRQAPYQVAGGWHQGRCTQGRTSPCWYRICKKDEFTPCMRTPVEMIAGHIRSTWDSLYS